MTSFMTPSYGGFPSTQYGMFNTYPQKSYLHRYGTGTSYFAQPYPSQPLYQPMSYSTALFPTNSYNQLQRKSMGAQFLTFMNNLDQRYQYEQQLRHLDRMNNTAWKQQMNNMAQTTFATKAGNGGTVYQFEREIRYIPYPVAVGPRSSTIGGGANLGRGAGITTALRTTSNFFGGPNLNLDLPPKIRVIFIPTGNSFLQQPSTGPLTMPPFLYNRIAQPYSAFPLPPPLPQLGSLSLAPGIQQMVMQRYGNPLAVLPFSASLPMCQPMLPLCSQAPQQQSLMPMPAFQPSFAPQASFPSSMPMSLPLPVSAPSYVSAPMPMVQATAFPPPPPPPTIMQSYAPLPLPSMPVISMLPTAAPPPPMQMQLPPAAIAAPQPMQVQLPPPPPPTVFTVANSAPVTFDQSMNNYPSICRACPPAPPSLGIPVTGHCWVQHCSACHHVPTPDSYPNMRPIGGRVTPLLRHPTVPQYIPDQSVQYYPQNDPPMLMRPWLRKTPPLPPGGVLIYDEYITPTQYEPQYRSPKSQLKQFRSQSNYRPRTSTFTTASKKSASRTARQNIPSKPPMKANPVVQPKLARSKSVSSSASSSSSLSSKSPKYDKTTIAPSRPAENTVPQQLAGEARSVNLRYNYQAEELPSVYLNNRYIKSSSEGSSPIVEKFNSSGSSLNSSPGLTHQVTSIKEEEKMKKPPLPPRKTKERRIVIREYATTSPSTISDCSTLPSDLVFSIVDKDDDTLSTTSTIKAHLLAEDEDDINGKVTVK